MRVGRSVGRWGRVGGWMLPPECVMFQYGLDAVAECVIIQH